MNLKSRIDQFKNIDIYPVISSEFCLNRSPADVLKQIADGGAKIVQLREKQLPKYKIAKLAEKFRKITAQYNMLLIINDHTDIALNIDADGVHLGQDDMHPLEAKTVAPELIIGVSTHSESEALEAVKNRADNINIGPIFATGTKSLAMAPLGPEAITKIAPLIDIPFTIMGGIKQHHIPELTALGATRIAMVTAITEADDITATVCELRRLITQSA